MGPRRRLGRRLEEVAKAVRGGYCRLQMLAVRGTVAGHRLGALEAVLALYRLLHGSLSAAAT